MWLTLLMSREWPSCTNRIIWVNYELGASGIHECNLECSLKKKWSNTVLKSSTDLCLLNVCVAETHNLPKQPPLAQAMGQATQCLALMARTGIGSCAFASVDDYLH